MLNPFQSAVQFTSAEKLFLQTFADLPVVWGDVFFVGSDLQVHRLAAGSSGNFLKTNGAGADPSWAAGGGSMAIGGTVTSGTTGSVLFVGAGPVLSQDNAKLFWDDTNFFLGIGIAVPTAALHVVGNQFITGAIGVNVSNTTAGTLQTAGAVTVGGQLVVSGQSGNTNISATNASTNGTENILVGRNGSGGTAAKNRILLQNDNAAHTVELGLTSTGFTPSGFTAADMGYITTASGTAGGLLLGTVGANPLIFGVNSAEAARITTAGAMTITNGLNPAANDGAALGTTALMWSDLFLASGGVINFNNGNATLTHSAGLITSNVSMSLGTSNVFTTGTIELGAASDTTLSRVSAGVVAIEGVTVATLGATQTFTGVQTVGLLNTTPQTLTVAANAATADVTHGIQNFTNSSAAAMTITLTTASAVDGQFKEIRIYDFSAVAQTVNWVNTENSTATVPATSNGSTTLPVSALFQYNGATSKWRCIATA